MASPYKKARMNPSSSSLPPTVSPAGTPSNHVDAPTDSLSESPIVVVHMPGSYDCVCNACNIARETLEGVPPETFLHPTDSTFQEGAFANALSVPDTPTQNAQPSMFVTPPTVHQNQQPFFHLYTYGSSTSSDGHRLSTELTTAASHMRFVEASFHAKDTPGSAASVHSSANNRNQNLVDMAIGEYEDIGVDMSGVVTSVSQVFSPTVVDALLLPMESIGVHYLSTAADFSPVDEKNGNLRVIDKNHKGCFFFTPLMLKDKNISLINNNNKSEFFTSLDGKRHYNKTFWKDNVDIKTFKKGGHFITLDMAAFLPDWTVAQPFLDSHTDAMKWMASHGPVFQNSSCFYLSLKQEYVHVFIRNMETELVAKARLCGFKPLFLLKNAICQQTSHYGLNGQQITTINIQPKSYLCLVGFFKGKGDSLQIITLKNQRDNFMVIANRSIS